MDRLAVSHATAHARVLVVEDEPDIAELLRHGLQRDGGFDVEVANRGDTALDAVTRSHPDVIVLDLSLPVVDGLDVCRILRNRPDTRAIPIIILTARTHERDKVSGLDLGADDYITKPFSLREVAARIRAVLRRHNATDPGNAHGRYRGDHLVADFDAVAIDVDERPVRLTRREFELLRYLVENRNRVMSRDRLLEGVWGYDRSVETRSVDVHVGRLRHKLGSAGHQIETVVGLGYRFVD